MDLVAARFTPRPAPRSAAITAALAAASAGLLVGMGEVARGAVRQGELRHAATARHSQAVWRCNTLRSMKQRDACLSELDAPAPHDMPVATLSR